MRKITDKQKKKNEERKKDTLKQVEFFLLIWSKRKHNSQVSGKWLGKEPLSTFFHHILSKERVPEARYDEDNIILLTFEEHETVENNPHAFPIINEMREKLKIKYDKYY